MFGSLNPTAHSGLVLKICNSYSIIKSNLVFTYIVYSWQLFMPMFFKSYQLLNEICQRKLNILQSFFNQIYSPHVSYSYAKSCMPIMRNLTPSRHNPEEKVYFPAANFFDLAQFGASAKEGENIYPALLCLAVWIAKNFILT